MAKHTNIPLLTLPGLREKVTQIVADGGSIENTANCIYNPLQKMLEYSPSLVFAPYALKTGKLYGLLGTDFSVTRSLDTATRVNSSGLIESVASGVPRIDWLGQSCPALLVEPAATNSIRNNSMVGASVSGNTLPTNWSNQLGGGITQTIVGTGTENGVSYIDIRFSGTQNNSTPTDIRFESTTQIVASNGQTWSESVWLKIVAAPNPPINYKLYMIERTSVGGFITGPTQVASLTTTLTRYSFTRALDGGATVARVQPALTFTTANGSTYDFTIRIGYPQMELGSVATSPIPTTAGTGSRSADVISASGVSGLIGQTEGTMYAEVDVRSFASTTSRAVFYISDESLQNYIRLEYQFSSPRYLLVVSLFQAGVKIYEKVATTGTDVVNGTIKIAFGYSSGNNEVFQNGAILSGNVTGLGTYASLTGLSKLNLGSRVDSDKFLNDRIRAAALYTTRLSNDQLAELTRL